MILEGILTVAAVLFAFALSLKLYNQHKLKKLQTKYPEGTETLSRPVSRLDDIAPSVDESSVGNIARKEDPVDPNKVMKELLDNEKVE